MKSFSATGYWYTPGAESSGVSGQICFDPTDGIRLTLSGTLGEANIALNEKRYETIYGLVDDTPFGRKVSIFDAFRSGITVRMPGVTTENIFANFGLVGSDFIDSKTRLFLSSQIGFDRLHAWSGLRGIKQEMSHNDGFASITIRYEDPGKVDVLHGDVRIAIRPHWSVSHATPAETTLKEGTAFVVQLSQGLSAEDLMGSFVTPLQDFLTFATNAATEIDSIALFLDAEMSHEGRFFPIFRPVRSGYGKTQTGQGSASDSGMLFRLADVRDIIPTMIARWFALIPEFEVFRTIVWDTQYSASRFLDERFSLLCHAMSLFFARYKPIPLDHELFREMLGKLIAAHGPPMPTEWIAAVVPSIEEMVFPEQLSRVIQEHESVVGPLVQDKGDAFVSKVIATKAKLEGRGSEQHDAFDGVELFWAVQKLRVVVAVCLLDHLGMPRQRIHECLSRNSEYVHMISTGKSPSD